MTATAQALAQQLWEAACYDEDGDVPMSVFLDMCKDDGITLVTPPGDTYCSLCQSHNCGNNCDRDYERWAGK